MTTAIAVGTLELGIQPLAMPLVPPSSRTSLASSFEEIEGLCSDRPIAAGLVWLSTIHCSGRQFPLNKPIPVREAFAGGVWTYRFDPIDILAYGATREDAIEAFCEEFACCWDHIACEKDDNLTADALGLKHTMLNLTKGETGSPE
ncbi:MAG: hypothetical protein QM570_05245 [Planctomycetota bacterium]|jgi:hypothetical protein|nr:hypothetical protein [Planctomycetota bacterium]